MSIASLPARQAYLDGELCGVRPDGTTSFSLIQNASDTGNGDALAFFLFDLLHLDGEAISGLALKERKERLRAQLAETRPPLQFSDHQIGRGRAFYEQVCGLKLESGRHALRAWQSRPVAESGTDNRADMILIFFWPRKTRCAYQYKGSKTSRFNWQEAVLSCKHGR